MRGACKMAQAHDGVNRGAGASNARTGREMGFGEEDGVVGWARAGDHLHRGEQRWTLDGRPLKERETACDINGNIRKEMYNETLRPILHSGHKQPLLETISSPSPSKQVSRTQVPSFIHALQPIRRSRGPRPTPVLRQTGGRIIIEMLLQG